MFGGYITRPADFNHIKIHVEGEEEKLNTSI